MKQTISRRVFLQGTMGATALGVAVGAGLLTPKAVLAAWPKAAFEAKQLPDALKALAGTDATTESAEIKIKAPDIAENGAVVPITISTTLAGATSIALIASENPVPLVANFELGEGTEGFASTRIKMGKSGDVVAVVNAGGTLYSAKKGVKVTIGGCGG
jgi:sulfur-oxidizing protein SoxY